MHKSWSDGCSNTLISCDLVKGHYSCGVGSNVSFRKFPGIPAPSKLEPTRTKISKYVIAARVSFMSIESSSELLAVKIELFEQKLKVVQLSA